MGEAIGKILFVVIALIVVASVGSLILSIFGLALALIPLLIKVAFIGLLIYLAMVVIRKLTGTSSQPL